MTGGKSPLTHKSHPAILTSKKQIPSDLCDICRLYFMSTIDIIPQVCITFKKVPGILKDGPTKST